MKKVLWTLVIIVIVFVIALIGGSFYMLDYSLAPDPNRMDTDSCYQQQFEAYPESKEWVDSLRSIGALRDTFLIMPSGECHHAFFVDRGSTFMVGAIVPSSSSGWHVSTSMSWVTML